MVTFGAPFLGSRWLHQKAADAEQEREYGYISPTIDPSSSVPVGAVIEATTLQMLKGLTLVPGATKDNVFHRTRNPSDAA